MIEHLFFNITGDGKRMTESAFCIENIDFRSPAFYVFSL